MKKVLVSCTIMLVTLNLNAQTSPSDIINLNPDSGGISLVKYKKYLIPVTTDNTEVKTAQQFYVYDQLGRLVRVIDSTNGNRTFNYDAADNRTSVTNN